MYRTRFVRTTTRSSTVVYNVRVSICIVPSFTTYFTSHDQAIFARRSRKAASLRSSNYDLSKLSQFTIAVPIAYFA